MRRRLTLLLLGTLLPAALAAGAQDPAALWRAGDVSGALAAARARLADAPDDSTARRWLERLTADPAELGPATDAADAAGLALVRDDAASLAALLDVPEGERPAAAALLAAGLDARRRGDVDAARDHLASVRPEAPQYAWARYHLARIAMSEGDAALARRYLDTADQAPQPVAAASVLAARWELTQAADPQAGRRLEQELTHRFPRSNALARVHELQRRNQELAAVAPESQTVGDAAPAAPSGRFSLQLAAFTDRGRAMSFRDAWTDHLPDLAISSEAGADGASVYRLRTGRFSSREQAEAAAEQIRRRHGLDALVVELSSTP
ncbi:MAG TPA: SPOR domain-containing protein [Candidatus Krumholzibacteria bacterium]|nr:SPOR domain-containing protein [Candidatus Krumholzibacteria bacterium]